MTEKTKRLLSCFLVVPLLFSVRAGSKYLLPRTVNVEKLEMIRVVGIDREGDGVHLTLAASGEQQADIKSNFLIEGLGSTFYEAVEDAQKTANKALFWGHADILVLGQNALEENISKFIDFLARDSKTRLSMKVMVLKNDRAAELLRRKGNADQEIYEGLSEQLHNLRDLSYASEVKMSDLIESAGNTRSSFLIPAAETVGEENYEITGAAAVKAGQVVRFLDETESRAANLVRGNFYRSVDILNTDLLGRISLEADHSRVKTRFHKTGNGVSARVEVEIVGTLAEQFAQPEYHGTRFREDIMEAVGEMWEDKLRGEIEALAAEDEETGNDILGLREKLYRFHPSLYERVRSGGEFHTEFCVTARMEHVHVLNKEI